MTVSRILFPVDFSELAKAVAPYVLSLAQRHKAAVVLMNVIQPPPPLYGGINMVYPETFDFTDTSKAVLEHLNRFGAEELPKVDVASVVEIGDPASTIINYAAENGIDLICLPTHGYGTFRRMLLGSVAAKVLHDARIPVWTDAHAPEASHRAHPQPRHVLVAIDPDKNERKTLDAAVAVAKESGATLDIVTAVPEGVMAPGTGDAELERLLIDGTAEVIGRLQETAGSAAGTVIEIGRPAKVVRGAALRKRADLVVVGRSQHGLGHLHDDTYAIVRDAPCPVLSV